jgi:hypothetical protein
MCYIAVRNLNHPPQLESLGRVRCARVARVEVCQPSRE